MMGNIKYIDEEILIKKTVKVLIKEPGPVEAIQFINMPRWKRLESVKRHREWRKFLDRDCFSKGAFGQNLRNRTDKDFQ
jgi:hypothetical protein